MGDNEGGNGTDGASGRADRPETCANCGEPVDMENWHPVVTRRENGDFRVYAFCDEDCRDEWTDTDAGNTAGGV